MPVKTSNHVFVAHVFSTEPSGVQVQYLSQSVLSGMLYSVPKGVAAHGKSGLPRGLRRTGEAVEVRTRERNAVREVICIVWERGNLGDVVIVGK